MRLCIIQEELDKVNNFLAANGWELVVNEGCLVLKDKRLEAALPKVIVKVRVSIGMTYEFTSYEALLKAVDDGRILKSDEVIEGKVLENIGGEVIEGKVSGNVGGFLMLYKSIVDD